MKIGIISGSHRINSQSEKVAHFIEKKLTALGVNTYLLNLAGNPLPMWDEDAWEEEVTTHWDEDWKPISTELKLCDGFVIISPEWSGMVPPGLKNFFLLCDKKELAHKPGYIVTVSSGRGGSYPVSELRMSSFKNTKIVYIPEHLIIRDCKNVLNTLQDPETISKDDQYLRDRLDFGLLELLEYTKLLAPIQQNQTIINSIFPNGL